MQTTSANGTEGCTDWNAVNWRQVYRRVRNLRQRIFRASRENDLKRVRSLQKLMLRCRANTLKSVRLVTQENKGKYTAGVDGIVATTTTERIELVDALMADQPWRASPVRRVHIPKANGKLRPLVPPTIFWRSANDRHRALGRMATTRQMPRPRKPRRRIGLHPHSRADAIANPQRKRSEGVP